MSNGRELPLHVREYLESREVDPDKLPESVLEALAGLSTREVELLAFIGAELQSGGVDSAIIARIH
jgi:asparagine synthetase B (glutamine-hydrolysing)